MSSINNIPAVILCGGLGLRLRSVVADRPKCLAPVNGRPFLHFLLDRLRLCGFTKTVLCIGYRGDQVRNSAGDGKAWNLEAAYSLEPEPLGTAGAVRNAQRVIDGDPFIVMNGDTMLEVEFNELIRAHRERKALATIALARIAPDSSPARAALKGGATSPEPAANRYGSVTIDRLNRITGFSEKPEGAAALINGGVYAFSKGIFEKIPKAPPAVSLEKDVFPALIGQGLYGFPCNGYFLDIGMPEDYHRAQTELPERFE